MEDGMARSCAHYLCTSLLSFVFRLNLRRPQVLSVSFLSYLQSVLLSLLAFVFIYLPMLIVFSPCLTTTRRMFTDQSSVV